MIKITGNLFEELAAKAKPKVDKIMDGLVDELDFATPKLTGYAASRWERKGNKLTNDADYIDDLNAGSSQQAPAYFIEQTLLAHEGVKPNGAIVRHMT